MGEQPDKTCVEGAPALEREQAFPGGVRYTDMECIAHRGFAGVAAENTLPAIRSAVESADGVEVDVRRCGSGDLVLCHDETVDRVTGATGRVADHTREALAALSVRGSGAGVPTLEEALDAMPVDVTLHAELKETGIAAGAVDIAESADCPVHVSSFEPEALREVATTRESADALPTAYLTREAGDGRAVERALDLECGTLSPAVDACTEGLVERAHAAGLTVNAWTVTDRAETRRLRAAGVDRVITDFPECCPAAVEAGRDQP